MKLVKKLLAVTLLSTMLATNTLASELGVDITTINQTLGIQDTFTFENIHRTISKGGYGSIVVTSINGAKILVGGVWLDVILSDGTPLDGVIRVSVDDIAFYALDENGNGYIINKSGIATKTITIEGSKIVDIVGLNNTGTSKETKILLLTESGELHTYINNSLSKVTDITKPVKKITGSPTVYGGYMSSHVLCEDGTLYYMYSTTGGFKYNEFKDFKVAEVYTGGTGGNNGVVDNSKGPLCLVKTLNDQYMFLEPNNKCTRMVFPDKVTVLSAVSDEDYNIFLNTTDGLYVVRVSQPVKVTDSRVVVVAAERGFAILDDGKYYNYTGINANTKFTLIDKYEEEVKKWANTNPVVPEYTLANFSFDKNIILERDDKLEMSFSLINTRYPKAFNLYYAKSKDINDKEKWKELGKNIPVSELNEETYETGYHKYDGTPINGKKYTYVYDLSQNVDDLTNIQLIAEPIYE